VLPATMTAAVLYGPGDLRVEQRPVPAVGPSDVAVRVHTVGICGTDLHYWDGWRFDSWLRNLDRPWILGHEFTGTVAATGDEVHQFAPGHEVVIDPWTACGECRACARGLDNFCERKCWMDRGGAWAEYAVVSAHNVYPLPSGLDPAVASMVEPLACVLRGFDRIPACAGDAVFIAGAGPIGLLALQVAKRMGAARTFVSEPHPARRDVATELGVTQVLDPARDDVRARVRAATRGFGADIAIEAAGANQAFQTCLDGVRDSGTLLVLSVGNPATRFEFRPFDLFAHELRIVGSNTRLHTFQRALDLLPTLDLEPLITHRFPLREAVAAVKTAKDGRGAKVVIECRAG